ncbi:hypothetical protein DSCW_18560 [Desulfosarcina widdelii]|uniref:Uncharacterized protein n=1 Tax=Desulfosarcina widdelii TaxID=947919 RepID=A0A5K7Z2E9_9BACT|nr:hypothetical protein [Desulfosarcina widdelii]BBO74439.1 hypothetical protein DSCW_18560 [Desulfosarcina widdelii]
MIGIINQCPICDSVNVLEFSEKDRGDDLPEDSPWSVPCGDCQKKLYEGISGILCGKSDGLYVDILFGCQCGCEGCLAVAKHLVGIPGAVVPSIISIEG